MIFWSRRRWISRSDIISTLEKIIRIRGNQVYSTVGIVERLVIIYRLVKKI